MIRCLLGALIGVVIAALLLLATRQILPRIAPPEAKIEPSVVYLSIILGAGFGAVCGAISRKGSA